MTNVTANILKDACRDLREDVHYGNNPSPSFDLPDYYAIAERLIEIDGRHEGPNRITPESRGCEHGYRLFESLAEACADGDLDFAARWWGDWIDQEYPDVEEVR